MAAPNIVNVSTITGKTGHLALGYNFTRNAVKQCRDQRVGVKGQHDPSGKCRWHQRLRRYG